MPDDVHPIILPLLLPPGPRVNYSGRIHRRIAPSIGANPQLLTRRNLSVRLSPPRVQAASQVCCSNKADEQRGREPIIPRGIDSARGGGWSQDRCYQ